jgi:GDPmannose 4,6-dehydratase
LQNKLYLGNLDALRDWGYAPEYVRAMWLMLQQERPQEYVVGTGENHSVKEFVKLAFAHVGLDWTQYVSIDARYYRATEVDSLLSDPSKAQKELGWSAEVGFGDLVRIMVDAELRAIETRRSGAEGCLAEAVGHTE